MMDRGLTTSLLAATISLVAYAIPAGAFYGLTATFKFDGENPHSGVVADFNADGIDDIAAVFPLLDKITGAVIGSRVNFLVGDGLGGMKVETTVSLPFDVRSMATGDFDGDGQPDLAVTQRKSAGELDAFCGDVEGMAIFFGSHDEVQPTLEFAGCEASVSADELLAFDANRDGLDDLVIGDRVALGNGAGVFEPSAILSAGEKNVVDVNADGVLDIVTETETVCGQGDGSFAPCTPVDNEPLVPVDADGMIVTQGTRSIYGPSSPSMTNPAVLAVARQPTADLNGDGIDDLVGWAVTSLVTPTETYWRNCDWQLTTVRSFHKRAGSGRGSGYYRSRRMWLYSCSTRSYPVAGWEQITYSLNRVIPATTALRMTLIHIDDTIEQIVGPEISGVIRAMHLTDVNGDGVIDVLASIGEANNAGQILDHPDFPNWTLFPGNGDGTFADPEWSDLPLEATMPGDFDGDGYTDYGWYETPFDSEHLVSVSFHIPMALPTPEPAPAPAPEPTPEPAPEPATDAGAQPTGATVEFAGTVTEVGSGYFSVDGQRVNIDATSTIKFQEDAGPDIQVGDPVEGKGAEFTDDSLLAVKAEFG